MSDEMVTSPVTIDPIERFHAEGCEIDAAGLLSQEGVIMRGSLPDMTDLNGEYEAKQMHVQCVRLMESGATPNDVTALVQYWMKRQSLMK